MSEIKIITAKPSDYDLIHDFLHEFFFPIEPMTTSHLSKDEAMELPPELTMDCIVEGVTLLAYIDTTLVGVAIAGEISSEVSGKDLEYSKHLQPKGADVFKFLSYIGEKADFCNQMNVSRSLHVHVLSTHPAHTRKGIGSKLFAACVDVGREKNFPAFSLDCTSHFTTGIAEKFGMCLLSTVTYDEYHERIGQTLFIPTEPHIEIKSYGKVYDKK